ncbi:hypothetical protein SLEP1_g11890 [Rubroshorea leprosula]|nr:hypothetical protein SLEP1_g11890 [Rubroshorea leprosula]
MFQTPIDPSVESTSVFLQDRSDARSSSNIIEMFCFLLICNAYRISWPRSVFLDPGATRDSSGCLLSLRHLNQELHWFKKSYGSWFLGDYVCEDGRLYTATPVDPVFILLPIFEEAIMKKGDDPGKFRALDEILFVSDYTGYQHLMSLAEKCMHVVCEIKVYILTSEIDGTIQMKSYLMGNLEIRLTLNNDLSIGREGTSML